MLIDDPAHLSAHQDEVVSQIWPDLYMNRFEARENTKHAAQHMKEAYDRRHKVKESKYMEGDLVWLSQPHLPGIFQKWAERYIRPFLIVAKPVDHMVQLVATMDNALMPILTHVDSLKPFFPPEGSLICMKLLAENAYFKPDIERPARFYPRPKPTEIP